jgi:hypothetical protein
LLTPLAKPCAFDILLAVRCEDYEVISVVDCSVLEIPLLDPMVKGKLQRPLGKKVLDAGLSARGSNSSLNLHTWRMILARFYVFVGKLLG